MGFESITGPNWIVATPPAGDSSNRTADTAFVTSAIATAIGGLPSPPAQIIPYGHLWGLNLSTSGPSTSFGITLGQAVDSTNADFMTLVSAYTKTTSSWAVGSGNGALDTGSIVASTWYWVFLIKRTDTGIVDILITKAVAATTPTPGLPPNYSEYRYIGSMKTNGSSQWTPFNQYGGYFFWTLGINDS